METLSGKTALITGAAKRLGREISLGLARNGVNVVIHFNTAAADAERLARECEECGVHAWAIHADLANANEVVELWSRAATAAGPLDILINNASIFPEDTIESCTQETLRTCHDIHLSAPLELSRRFRQQDRRGCIINLLDTRIVGPDKQHVSYHLSKRALYAITRLTAEAFAPLVRVNGVAPGLILPLVGEGEEYLEHLAHTNPLNRHGDSSDIVEAALYLLRSDFVTGQILFVDGGRHLRGRLYE